MSRTGASFWTAAQGAGPRPTVLLEISTGLTGASAWIRLTSDDADRVWPTTGGSTFTARPFSTSDFEVEHGKQPEFVIQTPDVDSYWDTWLLSTDFRWEKVNRYLLDRAVVSGTSLAQLDTFRISHIVRGDRDVQFVCYPLAAILTQVRIPQQQLTREEFPGLPDRGIV